MLGRLFKSKPRSILDETLDLIRACKTDRLGSLYSSDIAIISIQTYKQDIISYTKLLEQLHNALKHDRIIYRSELPEYHINCSLLDFMLVDDCYIDIKVECRNFLDISYKLIEEFIRIERLNEKSFNNNKNLMTINTIVTNITNLVRIILAT